MKLSHYKKALGQDEPLRGIWKTVNDDIQAVNKIFEEFRSVVNSIKSSQSDVGQWGRKVSVLATTYSEYEFKLALFEDHHTELVKDQSGDKKAKHDRNERINRYREESGGTK